MTSSVSPKPSIQDLQQDVIDLLEQISSLMARASKAFSSDSTSSKYKEFQQQLAVEAAKVRNLELKMAIVAPMKAGKSTIINAIVGQEILPNRNSAMTTLPTEIILDAELIKPTLTLSAEILSVYQETVLALQRKIELLGIEQIQAKIAQYPHLAELTQKIQNPIVFPNSSKIIGREEIIKVLKELNDITRLCSLIEPSKDPLNQIVDVPCITTPFWQSDTIQQSKKLGNLVIIDTPGPNEAGENLRLAAVVADQLQKSSMVLIVLDFTQLKTEAAEKVKNDVQRIINLRGKENLYVLINKVDQRRENDMTSEEVQQFVNAELGIGNSSNKSQVFEISARRAFTAANFLVELQQQLDTTTVTEMKTGRLLAQEVFGIDWEEDLEEATVEELQRKAERLWRKSGFEPFLNEAIRALIAEAAPRCIMSSLNVARSSLVELHDDVQLRSKAINEDEEKLRIEVGALKDDLAHLEKCRNCLRGVDTIKIQLQQELDNILKELKEKCQVSVESFFNEEEYRRANVAGKTVIGVKKIFGFIQQKENIGKEYIEFSNLEEAEEFADLAVSYPKYKADVLIESIRLTISKQIENSRQELTNLLEKEVYIIIERACNRLSDSFDIKLSIPKINWELNDTSYTKAKVESHTRTIDQGYEEKAIEKREWWHWFWIVPIKEIVQVKRPDKQETYYSVSVREIVEKVNESVEISITNIKQGINSYLNEDFKYQTDIFFNELNRYLSNYCENLEQAEKDHSLKIEEKSTLVNKFNFFISESIERIKRANTYLEYTDYLVRKK